LAEAAPTERVGMTVGARYAKTGLLVILRLLALLRR